MFEWKNSLWNWTSGPYVIQRKIYICIVTMAVPVDPVSLCESVATALSVCEDQLSVARSMVKPTGSMTVSPDGPLLDVTPIVMEVTSAIVAWGLPLGAFLVLHIVRQAWYIWGGEGAFAFPLDR
jgi:hypothetical protein